MLPPENHKQRLLAVIEAACLAPSSFNLQHCRYAPVTDSVTLTAIAAVLPQPASIDGFIGIFGAQNPWQRAEDYALHLSQDFQQQSHQKAHMVYAEKPRVQRDEMFRSAGMALQNMIWAAHESGYGAVLVETLDNPAQQPLLNTPPELIWIAGLALSEKLPRYDFVFAAERQIPITIR